MLVLAGAGCQPRSAPTTEPMAITPRASDATPSAIVADARLDAEALTVGMAPADAGAPIAMTDATVATLDAGTPVVAKSPPDVQALCAAHKRKKPDRKAVRAARNGPDYAIERSFWHERTELVYCTILRDTVHGKIKVTVTPPCCPSADGPAGPCAPSYEVDAVGTKVLVERAKLRADGTVVERVFEWAVTESNLQPQPLCGRRSDGIRVTSDRPDEPACGLGQRLAHLAELEAASVPAFDRLARELVHHRAPDSLVRRARRAARDEIRHARAMTTLAARHGVMPLPIEVDELPVRELAAIAYENAAEGCVREAYGALIATYQAHAAADPALRRVCGAIARDERNHAALAEDVDRWLAAQLSTEQRRELAAVRARTKADLRASLATSAPDAELGMPGGCDAVALFDAYFV